MNTSTTFKKKTRFQKEKEAREAKKNAELAAAASIYEDFVSSFDAKRNTPDKTFVSAGGSHYGPSSDRGSSSRDSLRGGSASFPALPPSSASAPSSSSSKKKGMSEMERMLEEMKDRDAAAPSSSSDSWGKPATRGGAAPSNRGGFSNAPLPGSKGSHGSYDNGDQDSTNLYVGNLAPGVTEESLMEQFGRFGDIYSIKVMWPRTDEERARQRNSGFVSFMTRSDAADAKEAMDGVDLEGYRITVGWGKAIKNLAINKNQIGQVGGFLKVRQDSLPPGLADGMHDKLTGAIQAAQLAASKAQAAHAATGGVAGVSPAAAAPAAGAAATAAGAATSGVSASGANATSAASNSTASSAPATGIEAAMAAAQALAAARAGGAASGPSAAAPAAPVVGVEREMTDQDRRVEVAFPDDNERKLLIDHLARFVSKDGQPLEDMVREREAANPEYKCLQEPGSAEGLYYRWKVWSLSMGDKERKWREKPFQMTSDGPFFIPPKMPLKKKKADGASDSEDSDDEGWREKEKARRAQREALRKERYKYMTGAQMEKARERQEREAREAKLSSSSSSSAAASSTSSSAPALPRGRPLSDDRYDDLEAMLRHLSASKAKIVEAMALALDCADCSGDVVELLEGSLCVAETPINVKVARLYLVSDVLHNSAAPVAGASTYRTLLQEALPKVFDHLNATYRVLGRMSAAGLEEKVMAVLRVWAAWSIYPPSWLDGLEATFYRKPSELDPPTSGEGDSGSSGSGSSAALAAVAAAAAELEALGIEELERKAKRAGVWVDPKKDKADKGRRLARKLALDEAYLAKRDGGGGGRAPSGDDDVDGEALDGMSSGVGSGLLFPATQPAWGLSGTNVGRGFLPVDGEPLDGEPLGGSIGAGDGGDVDGEPMDGEAMDGEPLDGEPLNSAESSSNSSSSKGGSSSTGGKKRRRAAGGGDRSRPSKYAGLGSSRFSDESGSEGSEDDAENDGSGGGGRHSAHGAAASSATSASAGGSWSSFGGGDSTGASGPPPGMLMSDEVRQQLRQVEVAVLQLRDELEDQGNVPPHEVEQQCAALRAQLRAQHLPP